ncbi:MAG TPA: HAMP domain-containing sensor histidine kinase [Phycisphaerae bacterium]|nr:HAMP domain-containing sensor histidine kinase [Phycisphaerae bacterium]HRY71251.1 HAMP domain-containing sensor histidine kinase [Phycisphaerae bacterium]HSA29669.1 HAMP domain-containing sensor histidine kinase [Phycisphaerae bacterium]
MKLRHKFGLLALLYVITLTANFAMCSWCLLMYYHSFLEQRASESSRFTEAGIVLSSPLPPDPSDASGYTGNPPVVSAQEQPAHETYIMGVLSINALCGLAVGCLGLRLVRSWVIRPIAALHEAVVAIGSGRFAHRINTPAGDELGELAEEVNTMAASIVTMQGQLVEHERRQVASQALRCIVHNIRSPLTGIRWLAEAIGMRSGLDPRTARAQNRIMEVVDGVLSWLQGFRESLAAMSMQVRETSAATVIRMALEGCAEVAAEQGVTVEIDHSPEVAQIRLEQVQFVSALQVLLSVAIARTPAGGVVRLSLGRSGQLPGYWQVAIECGTVLAGDSSSARSHRVSQDDLAMAERVVRLHGGRLEWVDGPSEPCRCLMVMPG